MEPFFLHGITVLLGDENNNQNILNHLGLPTSSNLSNLISCQVSDTPLLLSSLLSIPIFQIVVKYRCFFPETMQYPAIGPSPYSVFHQEHESKSVRELAWMDRKMKGTVTRFQVKHHEEFSNSSCPNVRHPRDWPWKWSWSQCIKKSLTSKSSSDFTAVLFYSCASATPQVSASFGSVILWLLQLIQFLLPHNSDLYTAFRTTTLPCY